MDKCLSAPECGAGVHGHGCEEHREDPWAASSHPGVPCRKRRLRKGERRRDGKHTARLVQWSERSIRLAQTVHVPVESGMQKKKMLPNFSGGEP